MKTLTKKFILALSVLIFLSSCGGDATSKNPDIAKLSDTSKKAMEEASKGGCECLKTHGKDIKAIITEIKPVIAEAEKSKDNPSEMLSKIMGPMMKISEFGKCLNKSADRSEEADKAMEEDLKKILGDNPDSNAKKKKQLEILQAYFGKNCPDESKTFDELTKVGEQLEKLTTRIK